MQTAPRPTPRRLAGRAAVALAAAVTLLASAPTARAAVYTWTGAHNTAGWADYSDTGNFGIHFYTSNWGPPGSTTLRMPPSSSDTSLVFGITPSPTILNQNLANPFVLNALTFTSGINAYSIGGNPLAFAANGGTDPSLVDDAIPTQTITAPVILEANLGVSVNSPGELSLTGRITGGAAGGIRKVGTGTLVLTGGTTAAPSDISYLNVSQGATIISGGALKLSATGSTDFNGDSSIFIDGASSLAIQGGAHVTVPGTPQVHNDGILLVNGDGSSLDVLPANGVAADLRVGYAGGTSSLQVANDGAVSVAGDLHVGRSTYAPNPGRGDVSVSTGGTLKVSGTLTLDGATDSRLEVLAGAVTVGALAAAGSSSPGIYLFNNPVGQGNAPALTVGAGGLSSTFAGSIHDLPIGPGTVQKIGTGTLTLSGQSDYKNGTILGGGTIRLTVDNALPTPAPTSGTAGNLTISSGTLDLNGHNQTLGYITVTGANAAIAIGDTGTLTLGGDISLAGNVNSSAPFVISGHAIDLGGATRTITVAPTYVAPPGDPRFGSRYGAALLAPITGTGGLTVTGGGYALLTAPNSYTGPTTVDAATLFLGADNVLPATTAVSLPNFSVLSLEIAADETIAGTPVAAGSYDQTIGSLSSTYLSFVTLGSATLTVGADNTSTTFAGFIQDGIATGGKLVKIGTGTLSLIPLNSSSGTNYYTGGTTLVGGTLAINFDGALGGGSGPLTFAGGTLRTLAGITSARPVAVTAPSDFDTASAASTFTGAFSGADVLRVRGGGSLTLSGATGTLGGISSFFLDPAAVTLDHSTLSLTSTGSTGFNGLSSLFADLGTTITLQNDTHLTTAGFPQIHNSGAIVVDGPLTTWTNDDPAPGTPGQIRVGYAGGTSTLTVRNGATVNTSSLAVGNPAVTSNPGVGAVTVSSGAHLNVFDQLLLTNGATLAIDRASVFAGTLVDGGPDDPPSTVTLTDPDGAPGTALVLNTPTFSFSFHGPITDGPNGPGGITFNGPGFEFLYNASYSGPTIINGGGLEFFNNAHAGSFTVNNGATLFFAVATLNPGTKALTANGSSTIFYNDVTINGGFLRGTGTHNFGTSFSPDSYVNGSTILPGTHVHSDADLTLTNVTSSAAFDSYNTLTWDGGYNTAAGTLNLYADATTNSFENDGALNVYATLSNSTSNLVSGGGSSINVSAGTIELNSTALELHAATLVNNGLITGGPTLVYANSTAKGAGTFGPISILSGGTFSPGNSPGSATTGSATWSSGGSYLFELTHATGTPGIDWDLWTIDGDLTLAATPADPFFLDISPFNLPDFDPATPYDWLLATVTGTVTGFDPASIVLRPQGVCLCDGTYSLTHTGGDIVLHYNPVPEPATLSLLALPALAVRRRRRRCC